MNIHEDGRFVLPGHFLECLLGDGEDVGVHGAHVLAAVCLDDVIAVDVQRLVRVDRNQHNTWQQTMAIVIYLLIYYVGFFCCFLFFFFLLTYYLFILFITLYY